jgi:hypothetical protein
MSTAGTCRAPARTNRGTTTPGPQPASTTTPPAITCGREWMRRRRDHRWGARNDRASAGLAGIHMDFTYFWISRSAGCGRTWAARTCHGSQLSIHRRSFAPRCEFSCIMYGWTLQSRGSEYFRLLRPSSQDARATMAKPATIASVRGATVRRSRQIHSMTTAPSRQVSPARRRSTRVQQHWATGSSTTPATSLAPTSTRWPF